MQEIFWHVSALPGGGGGGGYSDLAYQDDT